MHHYFEALTNTAGQSLIGYFARVIDPATQAVVTLASDNNGTPISVVSGVANMAKTDDFGNVSLYVEPGTYNLEIYGPDAKSFLFRVPNVAMNSSKGDQGDAGPPGPQGQGLADVMLPDGSGLVGFVSAGSSAVAQTALAKLRQNVSVLDYGATGDGITDDTAAFEAALAAARNVQVPPGRYFVRDINVPSFRRLYGAGKSPWEPYTGVDKPAGYLTELVVDGTDAINARNTNTVVIEGLAFASKTGKQSVYRAQPGYQPKSGGIAITGSSQFQARDVSFFGLEYGVHSHLTTATVPGNGTVSGVETDETSASANPTQMPSISDWQASDCKRVFAFGNTGSTAYTGRDVRISNEVIALHCGGIAEGHWCDGFRFESLRLYQCTGNSIYLRKTVFPKFASVTVFETGLEGVVLEQCENVDGAGGLDIARSGFYATPNPGLPQRAALRLTGCIDTHIAGVIERPTGPTAIIDGCDTTTLVVSTHTPFWQTGNATNASGAINITNSTSTRVSGSMGGENCQVGVWADIASQPTLSVSMSMPRSIGVVRSYTAGQQGVWTFYVPSNTDVGANGGVIPLGLFRIFVPAGKSVKARSVQQTSGTIQLRAVVGGNAVLWNPTADSDGSTISLEDKVLYDNTSGADGYYAIEVTLRNPSGATVTVPAGHEVRISTVIV